MELESRNAEQMIAEEASITSEDEYPNNRDNRPPTGPDGTATTAEEEELEGSPSDEE